MKKPKSLVLSIPSPCSESWDKMALMEKGRYCSNCKKIITDFTQYTDKQLVDFISNSNSEVCGKISSTQLNREIISYESGNASFLHKIVVGTALAASLTACNENKSNNTTQQTEKQQVTSPNKQGTKAAHDSNAVIGKVKMPREESKEGTSLESKLPRHKKNYVDTEACLTGIISSGPQHLDSNSIYTYPTTTASYKNIEEYINNNIIYPKEMQDKGIEGTVYVNFTVEKSGELSNIHVVKGVHPMLDSEAVRVLRTMPKWAPAKQNGIVVRTQFMLPIHFKLVDDSMKCK